ncbi:S9 family peptidase [Terriglobus roseus]|nr:S9 family peptidase [Terriglobus roseus]
MRLSHVSAVPMFLFGTLLVAQQKVVTTADYARAESRLSGTTAELIDHAVASVNWLKTSPGTTGPDRFWYRDMVGSNSTFMLVDAAQGKSTQAFDHARMASALNAAGIRNASPVHLPITEMEFADGDKTAVVTVSAERYRCDLTAYACAKQPIPLARQQGSNGTTPLTGGNSAAVDSRATQSPLGPGHDKAVVSPDGKRAVFIRNWNLWVVDTGTGEEKQLTTDGVENYGYATDNAGWTHSDRAVVVWSPDSKMVATFQQDQRKTGMMYLVTTNVGHPSLQAWKYPFAGDKDVTMIERVIIDTDKAVVTRLQMPADEHRSTLCDDISCRGGGWDDVQWAADGKTLAFVSTSRDHRKEDLRMADVATGKVRDVLHEEVPTYFESGAGRVNWRYLSKRNEILWFSERSDWGQLYLYDAGTGQLKHPVTTGDWNVAQVMRVDEVTGDILLQGVGHEKGWDPYYAALYRTNLEGGPVRLLTPENSNHSPKLSADGKYFVDTFSTTQVPPVTVLRDTEGRQIAEIAKTDIARLKASGWKAPESFTVKARDGKTDLYGIMFKPSNFDPKKKYPIINYIYPGPQTGSVGSRSFAPLPGDEASLARTRGYNAGLAELGFIVVSIDGMGTPGRSKKFHDAYFGNLGDNTLPDQIAGMKELAAKYSWIDLSHVGIWGHSGGGYATADAMFRYPEFFKVGWSESGNHDNRNYEDDWAEKWIGVSDATTRQAYEDQANQSLASHLTGKLMLTHGTTDDNVPPTNTLLVVDALMRAGKDFDLLMIPNSRHGYGDATPYISRRRWDYFVTNLMGATPPKEYHFKSPQ